MPVFTGLYRAKAAAINGSSIQAFIPQVFGDLPVPIQDFVGAAPTAADMGWVAFRGGNPDYPVWFGVSITQADADSRYVNVDGDMMTDTLVVDKATAGPNLVSNKTGAANVDGVIHMEIRSAGTQIGRITRATAGTAGFLTTSDADLKENMTTVDDELAYLWMRTIKPKFFNYKDVPDVRHVGYSAQEVAEQWPNGVSNGIIYRGHGDPADRTWDKDGNETTPSEVWQAWMMDHSKTTPILHACLQAVDRTLEARGVILAEQAAQIAELQEQVQDLEYDLAVLRNDVYYTRRSVAFWQYSNSSTAPPGSGQMRTSVDNTMMWLHKIDTDGFDRSKPPEIVYQGTEFIVRGSTGRVFTVRSTGPAIDSGTFYTIPITVVSGSAADKGFRVEITQLTGIWTQPPPPLPTQMPALPGE